MCKVKYIVAVLVILFAVLTCDKSNAKINHYEDQIGNTPFNPNLDDIAFKFCDSTNVLHKRALIRYNGGFRAMYQDLLNSYIIKENYTAFTGSIIVRFAVNCNGKLGRLRTQVINSKSQKTKAPKGLEKHLISITKNLKGWNPAYYNEKHADCYTFIVVKFKKGKIIIE